MKSLSLFFSLAAMLAAAALSANSPLRTAPPPGGKVVVAQSPDSVTLEKPANGSESWSAAPGMGFTQAIHIVSAKRGNSWDVQFHLPIAQPLAKNEVLLVHFWARMLKTRDESGMGTVNVTVQKSSPDWDATIHRTVNITGKWKEFYFPGVMTADQAAGTMTLDFRCGEGEQTVEFGGITLLSYGEQAKVSDLPSTKTTYPGRELDAPWRAAAAARIQKYRTAPIVVKVRDSRGKPVPDASVHIQMIRNAFDFGAAVRSTSLIGHTPDDKTYQQIVLQNFNAGSFINALKWPAWIGEWGEGLSRPNTLEALHWVKAHNLDFRGHVLVWPSWRNLPHMMAAYKDHPDKNAALKAVADHIQDEVTATRDYVTEFDVVNEPFDNHDLMDAYGRGIMVDWYKDAHKAGPSLRLSLNDYGILTDSHDTPHELSLIDNAKFLLSHGAPLNVIGLQGHFGDTLPGPVRVNAVVSRFAKLGCKLRLTEFTVDTDDSQLRADWTRDLMTVLYSQPAVIGFQVWTLDDLFDLKTGQPKPAGSAYQALALHQWRTDIRRKSDSKGLLRDRGYLGTYQVTATHGGKTTSKTFTLRPGGASFILTLD